MKNSKKIFRSPKIRKNNKSFSKHNFRMVYKIVAFILLNCFIASIINEAVCIKYSDGIYDLKIFYELEDDTVDVLFLGSSHAFEDYNTSVLWDEYGMASYILGGSMQPMWNTYYYLKEALKTQTPELIVLEGFGLVYSDAYLTDAQLYKNCMGLKSFDNRVSNIIISGDNSKKINMLFPIMNFHNRYSELSYEDFMDDKGDIFYKNWKGFGCNFECEAFDEPVIHNSTEKIELSEKTEKYYRKILEMANEKDISIVVIVNPYPSVNGRSIDKFNEGKKIASEYGVDFYDYSLAQQQFGIDYKEDVADKDHLNYKGSIKYSGKIGKLLVDNYDISDRRGDEKYHSWDVSSQITKRMISNYENRVCSISDFESNDYSNEYGMFIYIDDKFINDEHLLEYLSSIGIPDNPIKKANTWYLDECGKKSKSDIMVLDESISDVLIQKVVNNDVLKADYKIGKDEYIKSSDGINIVIYDKYLDKVVDNFGIVYYNELTVIRLD